MHCGAFEIFIGRPICATDGRTDIHRIEEALVGKHSCLNFLQERFCPFL